MPSGIYQIKNVVNGKLYIGSAADLKERKTRHFRDLSLGKHGNIYLQRAFKKFGEASFVFSVIEECSRENLISREQFHIDKNGIRNLFNICGTAGSLLGTKRNAETRKRMSASGKGRNFSAVHRARISEAKKGKARNAETREKLSAANIGKKLSPERIAVHEKPVQQIDKTSGKILATFRSVRSASQETKINEHNISTCCRGERKSAGGFLWRYL